MGGDGQGTTRGAQRAREVGREGVQDARKTRTVRVNTPLEALKIVLSETATGKRGGKAVALVDVRRAYFYAPARRIVFVELPLQDYQPGDEHMCGLLECSLYGTRDAAQNWEEELTSTLSDLKLTRGVACPCVWRGCIKGEDIVATVHGDDITIGGERSAVEFLVRKISTKCLIKKQVIGEDANFEKSGRILNRVIEWSSAHSTASRTGGGSTLRLPPPSFPSARIEKEQTTRDSAHRWTRK